ncbi:MAG: redoxin domain-containing protein [Candidatus Aminicenantales bacterium]
MSPGFSFLTAAALVAAGLTGPEVKAVDVRICASLDEAAPPGTGPVLLVFFSIECPVCYQELFEARYLVDRGRWPVAVIGVSLALRDDLQAFLEKYAWTSPVVLDRRKTLFRRFKVDAVPYKALLVGTEAVYRDDPYLGSDARREELTKCLTRLFSR